MAKPTSKSSSKFVCFPCSIVPNPSFRATQAKDTPKNQTNPKAAKETAKKGGCCRCCFLAFFSIVLVAACVLAALIYRQSLATQKPFMVVAQECLQTSKDFIATKVPAAKKLLGGENAHQDI